MSLILASTSPRRRDLLARLGVTPDRVAAPDLDESPLPGELPRAYALRLAEAKARAVPHAATSSVAPSPAASARNRRAVTGRLAEAATQASAADERSAAIVSIVMLNSPNPDREDRHGKVAGQAAFASTQGLNGRHAHRQHDAHPAGDLIRSGHRARRPR